MTATGRAAGRALFGDRVVQAWLPYDLPFAVRAFLAPLPAARRDARRDRAVAESGRVVVRGRRAALPRQCAPFRALRGGLCAHRPPRAPDALATRRRRRADRRARRAFRRAGRARAGGDRQPEVRPGDPRHGARPRPRIAAAIRRVAAGVGRGLHPRRRGGADPRRPRRPRAAGRHADRHRAAASAALRRRRLASSRAGHSVRSPQRQRVRSGRRAHGARRLDGRNAGLFCRRRRRVRRRQPAAAGRTEPD